MGSIAEALQDDSTPEVRKGPDCSVCALIKRRDAEDVELLEKWLSDTSKRYSLIADKLREAGEQIASGTLARHARGDCWDMRQAGRRLR